MGSRLLNGSLQLNVRVTLFPLILIELSSTVTSETKEGTILGIDVGVAVAVMVVEATGDEISVVLLVINAEELLVRVKGSVEVTTTIVKELITEVAVELITGIGYV